MSFRWTSHQKGGEAARVGVFLYKSVCLCVWVCASHRSELGSERERTSALQATASLCVQEKLTAEGKPEALELQKQSVSAQVQRYQEQNSVTEDLFSCQKPEQPHLLSNSPEANVNLHNNQVRGPTCHL